MPNKEEGKVISRLRVVELEEGFTFSDLYSAAKRYISRHE